MLGLLFAPKILESFFGVVFLPDNPELVLEVTLV
jgi:hypothetical protein